MTAARGKLPIVVWEQRKAAVCHTGLSTLLPPDQGSLLRAASSNKAERVLEREPTYSHGTRPCTAAILMLLQLIPEGCVAGNLIQCTQVDHRQSSRGYRRTTQSTELCVPSVKRTDSKVVVNLIVSSVNKQIKPQSLAFVINIVF